MTSGQSKQGARLAYVEADLMRLLLQHLPTVAAGRDTRFFITVEFNPFALPVSTVGQELTELALEALALRSTLGDPAEESVAQLLRTALEESADVDNHHRLGPARLAARLLSSLRDRFPTGE